MPAEKLFKKTAYNEFGFTLLELMITVVISAIIGISVFSAYSVQSKSYSTQREIAKIQQDMRGALYMMEFDLLNAGRDPNLSNRYGITDIRYYDYTTGQLGSDLGPTPFVQVPPPASNYFASFPVIEFTSLRADSDGDGIGDTMTTIRYQVFDFNNDGRPDLGRRVNGGTPDLVAGGVAAIGYAFAYNPNPAGDYRMARTDALNSVIWAANTNGLNNLDANIDGDGDGQLTEIDDTDGSGVIGAGDLNSALPQGTVNLDNIVAVRIWLLLQSERESPENVIDRNIYVVGNQVLGPFNDRYKRRLQTVTVALRNFRKT